MANFLPLKKYIFSLVDEMIDKYHLEGPFLDGGGGVGDTALHLAQRGWSGLLVDRSAQAVAKAKSTLSHYKVRTEVKDLLDVQGSFKTIVMLTVIEHIKNDTEVLRHLRTCYVHSRDKKYLIISMPINPRTEWRWDDDFYGHYRRYEKEEFQKLLLGCGFRVLEFWDYTFPFYWALRRFYTHFLPPKEIGKDKESNSFVSSMQSAWDMGKISAFVGNIPVWSLVSGAQRPFRRGPRGFEAIVLAETV